VRTCAATPNTLQIRSLSAALCAHHTPLRAPSKGSGDVKSSPSHSTSPLPMLCSTSASHRSSEPYDLLYMPLSLTVPVVHILLTVAVAAPSRLDKHKKMRRPSHRRGTRSDRLPTRYCSHEAQASRDLIQFRKTAGQERGAGGGPGCCLRLSKHFLGSCRR